MGRRGPKPTPTAIKKARGNPGKRALNDAEPQPPKSAALKPPSHLGKIAAAEFRKLAPQLAQLGILTDIDHNALANYCQAFELMLQCQKALKNGTTCLIQTRNGAFVQAVPEFAQMIQLMQQMKAWGAELGLSPSSRTGLQVEKVKPGSALQTFSSRR